MREAFSGQTIFGRSDVMKAVDIKPKGIISEWRPVSDLKQVNRNMSGYGYSKEYIAEHQLDEIRTPHCANVITGRIDFFEPLEVKEDEGEVFYRENSHHVHMDIPETFETQYGTFDNHNNGEFISWLGKDDYAGFSGNERKSDHLFGRGDFYIEGNFCDMFDCGEYSYAVSNLIGNC